MDLKIKDVAELLNVSEVTIRRLLTEGKIPAYRIKHQYRFNREEIQEWLLRQKVKHEKEEEPKESPKRNTASSPQEPAVKGGSKQYNLYRALHKGHVFHNVPGNTKEEVIRTCTQMIAKDLNLDADVITELLLEREALQPTSLNHGIGIPHTRDFLLNEHQDVVTIAFPEKPIAYGALDGKPVDTLFFLFACDDKRHLHLLAKIAHLSSHAHTLELLQSKPSKEKLLEYVKNWESQIQQI